MATARPDYGQCGFHRTPDSDVSWRYVVDLTRIDLTKRDQTKCAKADRFNDSLLTGIIALDPAKPRA
ncbi:MAG: hypothetical protein WBC93_22030 [Sulfitobacter sp.]